MEKRQRTNTVESSPPSPQEAVASLDPLVQPINEPDESPVYLHRQSSVFFIPADLTKEKDANFCQRLVNFLGRFSGILYALVASFLFTCSNFALTQFDIVLLDALIIRFAAQALMSLGFILYKGYSFWSPGNNGLILIRCLFATSGSISYYLGLTLLPLADLTTVRYTQVVWTAVLALIIFRERINLPTIFASILTLIGVVCVAQPSFLFPRNTLVNATISNSTTIEKKDQRLLGMILAVGCALAISMSIILNKKLMQRNVRQSVIMFYFFVTTLVVFFIHQIHYWLFSSSKPADLHLKNVLFTKEFLYASIVGILQIFPLILSQKSIKREHPSIVTVVQSSDIVFAILLQNLFTSHKSNLLVLLGSTLVMMSIFIVGGHKLWLDRQNRTCLPTSA